MCARTPWRATAVLLALAALVVEVSSVVVPLVPSEAGALLSLVLLLGVLVLPLLLLLLLLSQLLVVPVAVLLPALLLPPPVVGVAAAFTPA